MSSRESEVLWPVRAALAETHRVVLWRNSTGADIVKGVRYGIGKGGADLVGLLRGSGRFVAFEVKTATGRQSPEQRAWADAVRGAGGFYALVRSADEALRALERAEAGDSA